MTEQMAREIHTQEVINRSHGFCKFPGAINGAKRADIGPTGGPMRQTFHDLAVVPLSKSWFPPKAGSIFLKNCGYFVKKVA